MRLLLYWLMGIVGLSACHATQRAGRPALAQDEAAERMLIAQRSYGGWSQPNGNPFDYTKPLSVTQEQLFRAEKNKLDATIDDDATTKEIRYLVKAYSQTQNPAYKNAAEQGIRYLLRAQNDAGGWGQFYPDTSGYHKHITYNDHAMINVMWVLRYTADGTEGFGLLDQALVSPAQQALQRGLECILRTQYVQNGQLTVWCAQHDRRTLLPAKARAFELATLSGNESVGIVEYLMSIEQPSEAVKQAISAAVGWFERSKIGGIRIEDVPDPAKPKGKDRIVVPDATSTLWARFYDLQTNQPIFVGRDSQPKASLAEIEHERRIGYAYYGTWPKKLLEKGYPKWAEKYAK